MTILLYSTIILGKSKKFTCLCQIHMKLWNAQSIIWHKTHVFYFIASSQLYTINGTFICIIKSIKCDLPDLFYFALAINKMIDDKISSAAPDTNLLIHIYHHQLQKRINDAFLTNFSRPVNQLRLRNEKRLNESLCHRVYHSKTAGQSPNIFF